MSSTAKAREASTTVSEVQQELVDMTPVAALEEQVRAGMIELFDSFSISRSL